MPRKRRLGTWHLVLFSAILGCPDSRRGPCFERVGAQLLLELEEPFQLGMSSDQYGILHDLLGFSWSEIAGLAVGLEVTNGMELIN